MKTLEELRRIDEQRPVARLARLVERCARVAVIGGGALLVAALATMRWHTSALVLGLAAGVCVGGIGAHCLSALIHNPRRRRAAASPMRRENTGREGASKRTSQERRR